MSEAIPTKSSQENNNKNKKVGFFGKIFSFFYKIKPMRHFIKKFIFAV